MFNFLNFTTMAKQKGIFKIQGTIDNATFFERDGKSFVKKKSDAITKERIQNDPNFKRTRESGQEFGGSATVSSALQRGFVEVSQMLDSSFNIRAKIICGDVIKSSTTGLRGQRPFLASVAIPILQNLEFNLTTSFDSVFKAPYITSVDAGRALASITVPDFNVSNLVSAPSGATHFQLLAHVSSLSSYEWNTTVHKYTSLEPNFDVKHGVTYSAPIALGGMVGSETHIEAGLPGIDELPPGTILLVCIGIQFSQLLNGVYYNLSSNNAMKIATIE
jgi:hypothetical protein